MSKSNSVPKVLRVALKRVQTRWGKGDWSKKDEETGQYLVCLEGAITGGCEFPQTDVQREALSLCQAIIKERYQNHIPQGNIPQFNDLDETTQEQVEEVIKLALIRAETGGLDDPEENYIDDEELAFLVGEL